MYVIFFFFHFIHKKETKGIFTLSSKLFLLVFLHTSKIHSSPTSRLIDNVIIYDFKKTLLRTRHFGYSYYQWCRILSLDRNLTTCLKWGSGPVAYLRFCYLRHIYFYASLPRSYIINLIISSGYYLNHIPLVIYILTY